MARKNHKVAAYAQALQSVRPTEGQVEGSNCAGLNVENTKTGVKITGTLSDAEATLTDMLTECGLNPADYTFEPGDFKRWEVVTNDRISGNTKVTPAHNISIKLRRKHPLEAGKVSNALDQLINRAHEVAIPLIKAPQMKPSPAGPVMAVIPGFDLHVGKRCWKGEVGVDYDTKIAVTRWNEGFARSLWHMQHYSIDTVCFPIGQDVLHVDTTRNTTTAGTPMEGVDSRWSHLIDVVTNMYESAIIELLKVSQNVFVPVAPGNHDTMSSYCIASILQAIFRKNPRVLFQVDGQYRHYIRYGQNVIGFLHEVPTKNQEVMPLMWSDCNPQKLLGVTNYEIVCGHLHQEKTVDVWHKALGGNVTMRYLPAICPSDSWHVNNMYVGKRAAFHTLLYTPTHCCATFMHPYETQHTGSLMEIQPGRKRYS